MRALSGIRTRDASVRVGEDISFIRPHGHCDRRIFKLIYKNSVCTSEETHHVFATRIAWLVLFRELIHVYWDNRTKPNAKF
jgi:hypothetical protein